MELTAAEIARATGGEVIAGDESTRAASFVIDSRLLDPGGCFVAIRGTRDGHEFVGDAFARGASVAVVTRPVEPPIPGATLVAVGDPMEALAGLARAARAQLAGAIVVAVTGSAGKTATKDLAAAALTPARRVHASPASFNNEAGLPLTLLGAESHAEVIVAEMGARFAGNLAELAGLARPEVGVVTHVGMAHAEHLGGREGITAVKGELLEALPNTGLAILNDECDATPILAGRTRARVVRVGRSVRADVHASKIALDDELRARFVLETPWGTTPVVLALRGEHQVDNAAMAVTVAVSLGVTLEEAVAGLLDARPGVHRMELHRAPGGYVVINDAYNSSPTSAAAAVQSLARFPVEGRRVAVLGDMLELGEHSDAEHAALGALTAESGIDVLVAVGDQAGRLAEGARGGPVSVMIAADLDAARALLVQHVGRGDAVLVKASRAVGLERIARELAGAGEPR